MKYTAQYEIAILDALAQLSPKSSKNTLRSWIKEGRVQIEGKTIHQSSMIVLTNQTVTLGQRKKNIQSGLPILYEDSDLVIVNKPSGLLSVATHFEKEETLFSLLKAHYHPRKVFVVHRLDQDTSGVMVFALNPKALEGLKDLFKKHAIEREYTALVEGQITSSSGTWRSFQYEDSQYHVHETKDEAIGKLAVTHYQTLAATRRASWLKLQLKTGRKNQIRVHCASAGFPIVGDKKYGAQSNPLKRLCLHAHLLVFQHPISKKQLRFEAPVPEEFYRLIPSQKP